MSVEGIAFTSVPFPDNRGGAFRIDLKILELPFREKYTGPNALADQRALTSRYGVAHARVLSVAVTFLVPGKVVEG